MIKRSTLFVWILRKTILGLYEMYEFRDVMSLTAQPPQNQLAQYINKAF